MWVVSAGRSGVTDTILYNHKVVAVFLNARRIKQQDAASLLTAADHFQPVFLLKPCSVGFFLRSLLPIIFFVISGASFLPFLIASLAFLLFSQRQTNYYRTIASETPLPTSARRNTFALIGDICLFELQAGHYFLHSDDNLANFQRGLIQPITYSYFLNAGVDGTDSVCT